MAGRGHRMTYNYEPRPSHLSGQQNAQIGMILQPQITWVPRYYFYNPYAHIEGMRLSRPPPWLNNHTKLPINPPNVYRYTHRNNAPPVLNNGPERIAQMHSVQVSSGRNLNEIAAKNAHSKTMGANSNNSIRILLPTSDTIPKDGINNAAGLERMKANVLVHGTKGSEDMYRTYNIEKNKESRIGADSINLIQRMNATLGNFDAKLKTKKESAKIPNNKRIKTMEGLQSKNEVSEIKVLKMENSINSDIYLTPKEKDNDSKISTTFSKPDSSSNDNIADQDTLKNKNHSSLSKNDNATPHLQLNGDSFESFNKQKQFSVTSTQTLETFRDHDKKTESNNNKLVTEDIIIIDDEEIKTNNSQFNLIKPITQMKDDEQRSAYDNLIKNRNKHVKLSQCNFNTADILTHVIEGFVIQESARPFKIVKAYDENPLIANHRSYERCKKESTDENIKNVIKIEETEPDIKDDGGGVLNNTDISENKVIKAVSSVHNNCIDFKQRESFNSTSLDRKISIRRERNLSKFTLSQLKEHLKECWCPCMEALSDEEVDGTALILASEEQLVRIGIHPEHAAALCSFAMSADHNDLY